MRTISKDKYSLELTNALREFLKSKYNANTDIGSHTEMDAIKAGVSSPDYSEWSNLDEVHFVNDVHDLWNGKAEIEPEKERNYFRAGHKEDSNKDRSHKAKEDLDKAMWYINKLKEYV